MSKKAFMDVMRKRRNIMRDAISRGEAVPMAMPAESNSLKAAPLREWAKGAGVDQNDPLLLRALEAQEKAVYPGGDLINWRTNWTLWLDMEEAIQDFMEAHLEIKDAWPPNTQKIEVLLQKVQSGKATAVEIEEFRRIADEAFREWQPEYSTAFKERIETALNLLR